MDDGRTIDSEMTDGKMMDGKTIDGKTRLCGLIGNPVEHTMSPVIHNTLAGHCGHNLVYVPFLVEEETLRMPSEVLMR